MQWSQNVNLQTVTVTKHIQNVRSYSDLGLQACNLSELERQYEVCSCSVADFVSLQLDFRITHNLTRHFMALA